MCYTCWDMAGFPYIENDATRKAVGMLSEVWGGGNLHMVVDDWNMEDEIIESCKRDILAAMSAKRKPNARPTIESLKLELDCADHLLTMTEDERYSAMAMVDGFTPELRARNDEEDASRGC